MREETTHAYWGYIDHSRKWAEFDKAMLDRVREDGGLTELSLLAISTEYNVSKSMPRFNLSAWGEIAEEINKACSKSAPKLTEKAKVATSLVDGFDRKHDIVFASAVTKAMWFVSPEKWTPFDNHAARAMTKKSGEGAREQMVHFYAALDAAGFDALCERIQAKLPEGSELRPERIIDKTLMLRGSATGNQKAQKFYENIMENAEKYLRGQTDDALHLGARAVASVFGDDVLPCIAPPRKHRKQPSIKADPNKVAA